LYYFFFLLLNLNSSIKFHDNGFRVCVYNYDDLKIIAVSKLIIVL